MSRGAGDGGDRQDPGQNYGGTFQAARREAGQETRRRPSRSWTKLWRNISSGKTRGRARDKEETRIMTKVLRNSWRMRMKRMCSLSPRWAMLSTPYFLNTKKPSCLNLNG